MRRFWTGQHRSSLKRQALNRPASGIPPGREPDRPSEHFKQSRSAHSTPHAHGHHDVLRTPPLTLDQGVAHHSTTRHPIRMTDRNGPPIHIHELVRNSKTVSA